MIYAPHTLELTRDVDTEQFERLKNKAYKNAKKEHRMFCNGKKYIDTALTEHGIKIEYHDGTYKKKIKLIVNPTKLLGGDDVVKLWKPKNDAIIKLLCALDNHISEYSDSKYGLDDFKLTRIDFTVNINAESRKNVSAYIKVLQRIGKVKGFAAKYDNDDSRIDKNMSFDLEGKSSGVEFAAYDKEGQSKRKEAKGILRIEVRLKKQKSIGKYTKASATSEQICDLSLNSKNIFLEIFVHIVPYGDYYKKINVEQIIAGSSYNKKSKEKMLKLLGLIPKKKSLYLAQKEMKDRNIDKIFKQFAELNVSPITISKRQDVKYLKNLYSYLLEKR